MLDVDVWVLKALFSHGHVDLQFCYECQLGWVNVSGENKTTVLGYRSKLVDKRYKCAVEGGQIKTGDCFNGAGLLLG